jgi:hypothetical protein
MLETIILCVVVSIVLTECIYAPGLIQADSNKWVV